MNRHVGRAGTVALVISFAVFLFASARLFLGLPPLHVIAGPSLVLDSPDIDLGTVAVNSVIPLTIELRNVGNRRLMIQDVRSGCDSCLSVISCDRQIPPGTSGRLSLEVRVGSHPEHATRRVTIVSNDSGQPARSLPIRWISIQ